MGMLDYLYGQQPMGGVVGRVAADPRLNSVPKRGIMGDPDFARSLSRLGANLMVAGAETDNTLGAIGRALGATMEANQADRAQNQQMELMRMQYAPKPQVAFGGDGFDNQLARTQYEYYLSQGASDLEARQRAANDVLATKPQMQMVTDSEGRPQLVATPRPTLPMGTMQQGGQPSMQAPTQPDPIDQAAQAMGLQTSQLLPPPSGQGAPDMGLFQGNQPVATQPLAAPMDIGVPQMGGPKTQQALSEAAGKAQIDVEKETLLGAAKSNAERQSELKTQLAQLPMLYEVTDKLNNLAQKASYTLPQQASDFVATRMLGAPTEGDTARQEYVATVRNVVLPLLRSTFGAQFTAKEGESLLETLGNPDATPQAKQATLNAFIEQKVRNLETSAREAGVSIPAGAIRVNAPRAAIDALLQNPDKAAEFDAKFGKGSAARVLGQ